MQKAQSELAYDLQASITKQKIKEEEMQIRVVERAQQINVQDQVHQDLNSTVTVDPLFEHKKNDLTVLIFEDIFQQLFCHLQFSIIL